jgi:hypothetical protein
MKELRKTGCISTKHPRTTALNDNTGGDAFLSRAIGKTLLQTAMLWLHVGIGPMIGVGPMDGPRSHPRAGRDRRQSVKPPGHGPSPCAAWRTDRS